MIIHSCICRRRNEESFQGNVVGRPFYTRSKFQQNLPPFLLPLRGEFIARCPSNKWQILARISLRKFFSCLWITNLSFKNREFQTIQDENLRFRIKLFVLNILRALPFYKIIGLQTKRYFFIQSTRGTRTREFWFATRFEKLQEFSFSLIRS